MKRLLFALLLLAAGAFAQVQPCPSGNLTKVFDYDGSNNLIYLGCAPPYINYTRITGVSSTDNFLWTRAASTLTSVVVSTNVGTVTTSTAHGLQLGNLVNIVGSTTAALNGAYVVATIPSTTTFTIATSGVGDATYNNAAMTLGTTAPLTTQPVWQIAKFTYSGTNLTVAQWAGGAARSSNNIWANRTVTSGATKIHYE